MVEHLEGSCPNWEWQLESAKEICIAGGCLDQDMVKVQGIDITLFKPESSEKGRNEILGMRTEDYVTRVEDSGITLQSVEGVLRGKIIARMVDGKRTPPRDIVDITYAWRDNAERVEETFAVVTPNESEELKWRIKNLPEEWSQGWGGMYPGDGEKGVIQPLSPKEELKFRDSE